MRRHLFYSKVENIFEIILFYFDFVRLLSTKVEDYQFQIVALVKAGIKVSSFYTAGSTVL